MKKFICDNCNELYNPRHSNDTMCNDCGHIGTTGIETATSLP